jgi:hypothetical protein
MMAHGSGVFSDGTPVVEYRQVPMQIVLCHGSMEWTCYHRTSIGEASGMVLDVVVFHQGQECIIVGVEVLGLCPFPGGEIFASAALCIHGASWSKVYHRV